MLDYRTKVNVTEDNMISIFAGRDVIHPYRFQENVRIEVPFTEYVSFVQFIVSRGIESILHFNLKDYANLLAANNINRLRRYYLVDLSIAINNEVVLSHANSRLATQIVYNFDDLEIPVCSFDELVTRLGSLDKNVVSSVRSDLNLCSPRYPYELPFSELDKHNKVCYFYAVYLWSCAKIVKLSDYINII